MPMYVHFCKSESSLPSHITIASHPSSSTYPEVYDTFLAGFPTGSHFYLSLGIFGFIAILLPTCESPPNIYIDGRVLPAARPYSA